MPLAPLPTPTREALVVGVVYFVLSGLVGEWFPFTQVPMYADSGGDGGDHRRQTDVPLFLAEGVQAPVSDYIDFVGAPFGDVLPAAGCRANGVCATMGCSMEYLPHDAQRWMSDHAGDPGERGVPVTYVYRRLSIDAGGGVQTNDIAVWSGRARPRP